MQMVKESLNEGYCDISGHPTDMTVVGEMGGIKIYVAKGEKIIPFQQWQSVDTALRCPGCSDIDATEE